MKYLMIIALGVPGTLFTVHATPQARRVPLTESGAAIPEHGSISKRPALRWEDAFVPETDGWARCCLALLKMRFSWLTIAGFSCRLATARLCYDLATHVPELRRIIREENYDEAMKFFRSKAGEEGFPGLIRPIDTIPAYSSISVSLPTARLPATSVPRISGRVKLPFAGETTGGSSVAACLCRAPIT